MAVTQLSLPKISIITINLNNGNGLAHTIQSVVNQDYSNIEYIVIDGKSTDNSLHEIKQKEAKIAYWISEKDNGIYQAMNKGIAVASGDFLLFLNSGDYLFNHYSIRSVANAILAAEINCKDKVIFYGKIIIGDTIIESPERITLETFYSSSPPHPATFIAKKVFEITGPYDESYSIISDWCFFLSAYMKQVKFFRINIASTVYQLSGISSNFTLSKAERDKYLLENYPNLVADFDNLLEFRTFKLSRLHRWLEKIRGSFK